uniref:Uncharacterized protein n=1 Tax=Picea glauca TaxID=3330 RepID=A0A101LYP9_PICGL|nr:hypothetical protein ABT39_MTgene5904 [Picea glauca]QHR92070.1 hypothetical protein Q903MT_gene6106 [Picea sitchensis]
MGLFPPLMTRLKRIYGTVAGRGGHSSIPTAYLTCLTDAYPSRILSLPNISIY